MKVAVVGAGWAGMAAAVVARQSGHDVTVFEAAREIGGRARVLECRLPDGTPVTLDNGQHILIGAYTETLALMRRVGVDTDKVLLRMPLAVVYPDGHGVRLPDWPAPWDALAGLLRARGWSRRDKTALLLQVLRWRLDGFRCAAGMSVAEVCAELPQAVVTDLLAPLCVSALNTHPAESSGQVFLRVLQDALFGARGSSHVLIPRTDLTDLFPGSAAQWLATHGAHVRTGSRITRVQQCGGGWRLAGEDFDRVVLATPATDSWRLLGQSLPDNPAPIREAMERWCETTGRLQHRAITTVYAWAADAALAQGPMLALPADAGGTQAQFVFDRGQLGGPRGLLAFVVSASVGERSHIESQVLAQAQRQLGMDLQPVQTVVEKRATVACTPGVQRPPMLIAPALLACGDYVDGPYPSTLEAAVRNGLAATRSSGSAS